MATPNTPLSPVPFSTPPLPSAQAQSSGAFNVFTLEEQLAAEEASDMLLLLEELPYSSSQSMKSESDPAQGGDVMQDVEMDEAIDDEDQELWNNEIPIEGLLPAPPTPVAADLVEEEIKQELRQRMIAGQREATELLEQGFDGWDEGAKKDALVAWVNSQRARNGEGALRDGEIDLVSVCAAFCRQLTLQDLLCCSRHPSCGSLATDP